jgi:hypothetical protein
VLLPTWPDAVCAEPAPVEPVLLPTWAEPAPVEPVLLPTRVEAVWAEPWPVEPVLLPSLSPPFVLGLTLPLSLPELLLLELAVAVAGLELALALLCAPLLDFALPFAAGALVVWLLAPLPPLV